MKILFVCTGNTCRSPMAELFFNHHRRTIGKSPCAGSCGISTADGLPISANAAAVMLENEIDPDAFASTAATREIIDEADFIFTMTSGHRRALVSALPEHEGKIFTLLGDDDVSDPFGQSTEVYRQTFEMRRPRLTEIAEKMP